MNRSTVVGLLVAVLLIGGLALLQRGAAPPKVAEPQRAETKVETPTKVAQVDAPPPVPIETAVAPAGSTSTTIVVLRWDTNGIELVRSVDKPDLAFDATPEDGGARFLLEDAETGVLLASGPCALPRLCTCDIGRNHARGDVMVRHEAVVRLKLPRLARRERLRIESPVPGGWERVGEVLIEERS